MSVTLAPKDRRNESPAPSSAKKPGAKGLRIGAAGDAFEREADHVADRVMSGGDMPEWSFAKTGAGQIQRQPTPDPSNQAGTTDQQTAPQPNNYKDAAGKLGEAFLQTDVGKKLKNAALSDPLVKGAEDFVGTLPGKIITGAAAAAAVSTLAATHKALPVQIPEIPLDVVHPGLKVKVTYEGAVDHPTKAMITFSFTPGGDKKKKEPTASQRYLAETAPIAASMDEIRAGMHYAPGSPQAQQEAADKKMFDEAMARRFGSLPGTGGVPLIPPKGAGQAGAGQAGAGGSGWTFSPLALPELDKKLDLQPLTTGSGATLQRKCACQEGSGGECEECKKKSETVQRKAAGPAEDVAPPIVDQVLSSSGRPLDKATRDYFEPRFGYDFSKVRIHSDAQAAESARAVNALAYTVGERVAFASGRYSPQSSEGRRLLAHELAHTIQQTSPAAAATHTANPGAAIPSRAFKSNRALHAVAPGPTAPSVPCGASRQMQRKIELRDQPHVSGFVRVPELLNRLSAISPNLKFTLGHSNSLNIESKTGAKLNEIDVSKLNNFEKQMVGYVKSPNLIPLRITTSHGRLGDPQHGFNTQIAFDDYHSGYVDIDDLLASDDLGLQEDLVHFLRERNEVPNYAGRLGSDSLAQTTRESHTEFEVAHEKGIDAEEELMRGFFGDRSIQFNPDPDPKVGPGSRGFINNRNDHIYTIMQFGTGSQSGVQSFHVHVETADGRTLTPDQFKALVQSRKGAGSVPVHPKTANGAQPNLLPGLRISVPGDALEQEADCTAEAVLNSSWQSLPATPSRPSADMHPQSASASSRRENAPAVQREAAGPAQLDAAPPVVGRVLQSSGRPLDKATRDYFEPRFGYDFSKVRIHTDAQAAESARSVNALAYTVGDRIAFAAGRYSPQSSEGRRLLAHELTHTMQQSGTSPAPAGSLRIGAANSAGEQAANAAAAKIQNGHAAPVAPNVGKQDRPSVQRDGDSHCGPDPCPTDEDIYKSNDEYLEKIRKRDEEDRRIRATPIEERISRAVSRLRVYGYNYQGKGRLWDPSGEEVWQYGYDIDPAEEPRRLFTEDERVSVIARQDGYNAAELEKAHEQLERLKRKAAWEHEQAILAPIDQIASPEGFVQGPLVSAINPLLGLTLAIGVGAPMVHEAFNACRSGLSLDCADKMVPLLAAAAAHGLTKLAGGPEIEPVAEQRALKPAIADDPAAASATQTTDAAAGKSAVKSMKAGDAADAPAAAAKGNAAKAKPTTMRETEHVADERKVTVTAKSGGTKGKVAAAAKKGGSAKANSAAAEQKGGGAKGDVTPVAKRGGGAKGKPAATDRLGSPGGKGPSSSSSSAQQRLDALLDRLASSGKTDPGELGFNGEEWEQFQRDYANNPERALAVLERKLDIHGANAGAAPQQDHPNTPDDVRDQPNLKLEKPASRLQGKSKLTKADLRRLGDPRSDRGDMSTSATHPDILRANWEKANHQPFPDGHEPHHIVPTRGGNFSGEGENFGDRARTILERDGIDGDDAENCVPLPGAVRSDNPGARSQTVPQASTEHGEIHTKIYYQDLAEALEESPPGGSAAVLARFAELLQNKKYQ